jgi:hypothetical protein
MVQISMSQSFHVQSELHIRLLSSKSWYIYNCTNLIVPRLPRTFKLCESDHCTRGSGTFSLTHPHSSRIPGTLNPDVIILVSFGSRFDMTNPSFVYPIQPRRLGEPHCSAKRWKNQNPPLTKIAQNHTTRASKRGIAARQRH